MNLDDLLQRPPDAEPTPFFARKVMRAVRDPEPLAFPWRRVVVAVAASAVCVLAGAMVTADVGGAAVVLTMGGVGAVVERLAT